MKKGILFLFICTLSLCACKITKNEPDNISISLEKIPVKPHAPSSESSPEQKKEGLKQDIAGFSKIYNKMKSWMTSDPDFSEGIIKANEIESTYGERIQEILSITPDDLTESEVDTLSNEIHELAPLIREVNDMFEFR